MSSGVNNNGASPTKVRESRIARSVNALLALLILYTLYFAQSLVIPIIFTVLTALLLSPLVTLLKSFHIPRAISAVVLLALLVAPFSFLGVQLAEPAQKWAQLVPKLSVQLTEQLESMSEAYEKHEAQAKKEVQKDKKQEKKGFSFFGWFADEEEELPQKSEESDNNVVKERIKQGGMEIVISVLSATPAVVGQLLASMILILFLLIFGPSLFNVVIQDFPIIENKKRAVFLISKIQRTLSQYILTISIINSALGLSTAAVLHLLGVDDAILWGSLVGLLNFVPYVGSLISLSILCLAGAVQYGFVVSALLPAGVFLLINIIESQFITPAILGRNMQVNPLIIVVWLLILGWLWGILGVLLAVPILVCIKLTIAQLNIKPHWLKFIEAR